ncbi:PfkB family carbohydrate kinase, partial [Cellulosimicrobium sp. CpK407]|uniref:PfkB family carbohydrate kinase n=1 Tax=Cellulosimicrobium sp. CpK407 TaxID=3229847 RepID=UPI003F332BD6
ATITYDPNARPALMGDPADARARIEALVALADVVKVSDEDLAWLVPGTDPVAVARDWLALGPALVVVTYGGEGALALTAAGEQRVTAPRVEVVDTVGAGDSFMGALLDGLWDAGLLGADRRDALRAVDTATLTRLLERCAAVAAVTVSRAGANPPRRAELTTA